jgi:hypothetical protein
MEPDVFLAHQILEGSIDSVQRVVQARQPARVTTAAATAAWERQQGYFSAAPTATTTLYPAARRKCFTTATMARLSPQKLAARQTLGHIGTHDTQMQAHERELHGISPSPRMV